MLVETRRDIARCRKEKEEEENDEEGEEEEKQEEKKDAMCSGIGRLYKKRMRFTGGSLPHDGMRFDQECASSRAKERIASACKRSLPSFFPSTTIRAPRNRATSMLISI